MQHKEFGAETPESQFSLVYLYLTAGIAIAVAVFLFIPRISTG